MKKVWLHLILLLLAYRGVAWAGDFKRFEFQPFGGFTASGTIPLTTDDNVNHGFLHVNSSYNVGATLSVNLNDLDAVEGSWQRQFSEGRLPAEIVVPSSSGGSTVFNLKIDQFHCNFLHHYTIADRRAMPYIMAGLGATTYYGMGNGPSDSRSYFSFALGGGMKYRLTSHFGFRAEARWSPTLLSPSDISSCTSGGAGARCLVSLKTALQHQLDLTGGIVFRF